LVWFGFLLRLAEHFDCSSLSLIATNDPFDFSISLARIMVSCIYLGRHTIYLYRSQAHFKPVPGEFELPGPSWSFVGLSVTKKGPVQLRSIQIVLEYMSASLAQVVATPVYPNKRQLSRVAPRSELR